MLPQSLSCRVFSPIVSGRHRFLFHLPSPMVFKILSAPLLRSSLSPEGRALMETSHLKFSVTGLSLSTPYPTVGFCVNSFPVGAKFSDNGRGRHWPIGTAECH